MDRLSLSLSMGGNESMALGETYRDEGLSININKMRFFGEEIPLEVTYDDLIFGQRIGQGACSSVNLARHRVTNQMYAVKFFNILDKNQASQLYNEIYTLASFQCDALISLKGVFHQQGCIGIVLEFMDLGSLEGLIKYTEAGNIIPEEALAGIAFQVIWGLCYLNYENQIHRDIKPGNILMNSHGSVKLSDFGISRDLGGSELLCQSSVGSFRYMSLERLDGGKYDSSADVWSVAVTLIEIWSGKYPFKSFETPIHLYEEIQEVDLMRVINSGRSEPSRAMVDFFLDMMTKSYKKRLKATELIGSQWFKQFKIYNLEDAQAVTYRFLRDSAQIPGNRDVMKYIDKNSKFVPSNQANNYMNMSISFGGYDNKLPLSASTAIMRDVLESSIDKFGQSLNKSMVNNPFLSSFNSSLNNNFSFHSGPSYAQNNNHRNESKLGYHDDHIFNNVGHEGSDDEYYDDFEAS